ncbi:MAG: M20/M25/M40 family metallo-hydrolase [Acidobacteria bacterium]|nr:M20/M25/M40 family metallo-hydrolase [Acidobacteriota bacterium]
MSTRVWKSGISLCLLFACTVLAQEKADLNAVHRIKAEAFENSKVMEHLFYLTDVHAPRISNSPGYRAGAEWTMGRLKEYGLENIHKEAVPFGRGWSCRRFSVHLIEPEYAPLIGIPLAWTQGTNGPIAGEPVLAVLRTDADLEKFKGKLKGRIVLTDALREIPLPLQPDARRYSEIDLAQMLAAPEPGARPQRPVQPGTPFVSREEAMAFRRRLTEFLRSEGVAATIGGGLRGNNGTVFATSGGSREMKDPVPPPGIAIAPEHYNRLYRLLDKKVPVKLELEMQVKLDESSLDCFNILAEIPGSDKKDEVVMLGGHFDTWHGGTGATDNSSGVSVAMEAARILKTLKLPLSRTVRLGFWAGEEAGFIGSRAYVKEHFADRETMQLKPDHARLAAYFNYDNGGGKIRGIYLQNNDMARPVFEAWLNPLKSLGAGTATIRNTSGTDHLAFDEVGLPGFQFIQDPLAYDTRTHHSNMDLYDAIPPGDLMQSSAVMAVFAYQAANREQAIPRKPLPTPQTRRRQANP